MAIAHNHDGAHSAERIGSKVKTTVAAFLTSVYCACLSAMPAFATTATGAADAITQGVSNGTRQMWMILVGIVGPVATIALAVCAFKVLWGSQRAADDAKNTAIKIVVVIAVVLMAPSLISVIRGWFTSQSSWTFG